MPLHVPSFGGGVVRLGSPNVQRTDELLIADSLDIGPRGQLVCASDVSAYLTLLDTAGAPAPWSRLYALGSAVFGGAVHTLAVGEGVNGIGALSSHLGIFDRSGAVAAAASFIDIAVASGMCVTILPFPGRFQLPPPAAVGQLGDVVLLCLGARDGDNPNVAPGLWVYHTGSTTFLKPISYYSALGDAGASKQLYPRGIVAYNNFVFAWGFDAADTAGGLGPNRVMFCNAGNPLKWGNDNQGSAAGRAFTDSDAIVLGDAGEQMRGALKWSGRLYFGTNQQLHYIGGFGRNSFLTDGANPVAKSYNVVGPSAMIEGPDRLMYGVADQGLWSFDGSTFDPLFKRLVDFAGHSVGYWDCIWADPTRAAGYPGRTNQDLVWLAVDWDREQVLVGIPFCNAATGAGPGNDTVVLKYHTRSGGFTRQVFVGVAYTCAAFLRRDMQQREARFLGTATAAAASVQRYAYQATPTTSPILPAALPRAKFGPYLPFGPDGEGVLRRCYLTLAWEAVASLPLVFTVTIAADDSTTETRTLTVGAVAPGAPVDGDLWLDTSQTDANLGNTTAGAVVSALGGYLLKTRATGQWVLTPGSGEIGQRASIPIPLVRRKAGRVTIDVQCTAAAGRFEIEDLGINPGGGKAAA